MKLVKCILIAAVVCCLAGIVQADKADDVAKENRELKQRLDRMEKQIQQLLASQNSTKPSYAVPESLDKDSVDKLLKLADGSKKPVMSNLAIDVYGKIKLDASHDSDRTTAGNYVRWVDSQADKSGDDEFNMTARETRLGFNISGPENNGMKTSGKVEVDFYAGATENKNEMMMRHAYMKLDWPADKFSIIAGQTWDVISPLNPSTLNYSVLWWQGNTGYRRPQIRLTKGFDLTDDVSLTVEGAVARTIGDSSFLGSSIDDSGADSGQPTIQGRAGFTFPLLGYKPTTLGISGHWGEEDFDTNATGSYEDVETWSVNLDLVQPINEWLTIKGELFCGENLDAFLGGIGQGVNATTGKGIASKGGWISAAIKPWDRYKMNFGVGIDDPDNNDVDSGGRSFNRNIFGNIIYAINDNTDVGFELSQQQTKYREQTDAENLRAQLSFIYKF